MQTRHILAAILSSSAMVASANAQAQPPQEVIVILDTTGSTGGLIGQWKTAMKPKLADLFHAIRPGSRFALVTHDDFPFPPFGNPGDVPYKLEVPMTEHADWDTDFQPALDAVSSTGGGDTPESQYVAIKLAVSGGGLDLNADFDFTDPGEVDPADNQMGVDLRRECVVIHFTAPDVFHDADAEPNYPMPGVPNAVTPGKAEALGSLTPFSAHPVPYYQLKNEPLLPLDGGGDGAALAASSGGLVLNVGVNLEFLEEAIVEILVNEDSCVATVETRNAGTNPGLYAASEMVTGADFFGLVDLSPTGFDVAALLGYTAPANLTLPGGQTLLVDLLAPGGNLLASIPASTGPLASFAAPVPSNPALCGITIYTQAGLLDSVTGEFVLTNAQDLLIGAAALP